MSPTGRVPRPRARLPFGRSPKSDQKRCLKPQVSRLPARLGCAENRGRVPRENQDSADRRTTNRVRSSCRCRSCVSRGGALVYRRGQKGVAPEREIFPPEANMRTRVQPAIEERKTGPRDASPCGVRDRSREKRPAPEARNTFFTSYHKSTKDCNARSAFPAAGHCI